MVCRELSLSSSSVVEALCECLAGSVCWRVWTAKKQDWTKKKNRQRIMLTLSVRWNASDFLFVFLFQKHFTFLSVCFLGWFVFFVVLFLTDTFRYFTLFSWVGDRKFAGSSSPRKHTYGLPVLTCMYVCNWLLSIEWWVDQWPTAQEHVNLFRHGDVALSDMWMIESLGLYFFFFERPDAEDAGCEKN